jgi:endonuclease/exonuclease/phosphatase family metal-dependent hydrolase
MPWRDRYFRAMQLISWNVQWCRGLDGRVDPARIVAEIRRLGDFDVICLQEIADNFPDPRLAGSAGEDQFAALAALLPAHALIAGRAVDHPGDDAAREEDSASAVGFIATPPSGAPESLRRRRFGNAVFSRLPIGQVFRHTLPFPHDAGLAGMPRIAIEAVVIASFGALRVITTHLEYFSRRQRAAQVDALRAVYAEGYAYAGECVDDGDRSPFQRFVRPAATLFCGDFNMPGTDPLYDRMLAPFDDGTPRLHDAWNAVHPNDVQPPSFCVHQPYAPGMKPYACDFVFVNDPLREHLRDVQVDLATLASDHQPVLVTLR